MTDRSAPIPPFAFILRAVGQFLVAFRPRPQAAPHDPGPDRMTGSAPSSADAATRLTLVACGHRFRS